MVTAVGGRCSFIIDILCTNNYYSGNDTSYDEQTPPKVPKSLMKELKKHSVEDNYRTQNWGGSGGDWCR